MTASKLTLAQVNKFIMDCVNGVEGSITDMNGNVLSYSKVRKNTINIDPPKLTKEGEELQKFKMKQEALRVRKNELQQMRRKAAQKAAEEEELKKIVYIPSSESESEESEVELTEEQKEFNEWKKEREAAKAQAQEKLEMQITEVVKPKVKRVLKKKKD